jgi:hypothetical protein
VTVSIDKPTQQDLLELATISAELVALENDQDLDKEVQ